MLRIRLKRMGRKKHPVYRIVVADQRSSRDGGAIDEIGVFDPLRKSDREVNRVDCDRYNYWISKGAQPTDRVRKLCAECKSGRGLIPELIRFLRSKKRKGSYSTVIGKIDRPDPDPHYLFEAVFAYQLSQVGFEPEYEAPFANGNAKTVDFLVENNGVATFFELLRVDESEAVGDLMQPDEEGFFEVKLSSDHPKKHLRPAAQDVRMQEKLCDKVDKFTEDDSKVAVLVVDCSTYHLGMMDGDDIRSVMSGVPKSPSSVQSLDGKAPVVGLLDPNCPSQKSEDFRKRISAVVFVPNLGSECLKGATVALNVCRSTDHQKLIMKELKQNAIFSDMHLIDY